MNEKIWLKKLQTEGHLQYMTKENMNETLLLRQMVREGMREKQWFAESTQKDFEDALQYGFGLVCVVHGKIVASLQCLLEHTDYSRDCFENEEMWIKCADYSDTFVHPEYRGNGLQKRLEEKMEELCKEAGKSILLGTVDPDNRYSYQNFLNMGYKEVRRLKKYGGLERALMRKNLD